MGGAKCSYKNCTVRSDAKTHMFHYPVLDRPRCHQWLVNCNRYDFLSLTVSQLKNRRVCQNHFTMDSFMNELMTKLKPDAIPTLDGPYCDLKKLPEIDPKLESFDPVGFEDIENLKYPTRYVEKATFSKTYSNFLTDNDMAEEDTFKVNTVQAKPTNISPARRLTYKPNKTKRTPKTVIVKSMKGKQTEINTNSKMLNECDQLKSSVADSLNTRSVDTHEIINTPQVRATKIQILSEEKLIDPVPVPGPLKTVKPNTVLSLPNRKYKKAVNNNTEPNYTLSIDDKLNITIHENTDAAETSKPKKLIEIDVPPINTTNEKFLNLDVNTIIDLKPANIISTVSSADNKSEKSESLLKMNAAQDCSPMQSSNILNESETETKLFLKRATAIEKKRNFNKRLRDMISFQMDLSSLSPNKPSAKISEITNDRNSSNIHKPTIESNKPSIKQCALKLSSPMTAKTQVKSHLSEDESLPNIQSYNALSAIEARLKHMEELMLAKIEHNTQNIVNLKKSVEDKCLKKYIAASTQTDRDELSHKKYLYREISKYLSTDAKSLIYEELFINKLVTRSAPKRRKVK